MQRAVCLTEKHLQCKFFKQQSAKQGVTVLVVEDNYFQHEDVYEQLSHHVNCDVVLTAEKALQAYMLAIKNNEYYDALLINVQIPEMDGVEVIDTIRGFEFNTLGLKQGIPILLLCDENEITVKSDFSGHLRCIERTHDTEELLKALQEVVGVAVQ